MLLMKILNKLLLGSAIMCEPPVVPAGVNGLIFHLRSMTPAPEHHQDAAEVATARC